MPKLRVNEIDLYYESTGHGQPLLFINGLGANTRSWDRQADYFASQYQVVTFDLRGQGQSHKPPGPYSIPLFARDTAALIIALGLEPVHVVGLSLGGAIAMQLAVDMPHLVHSLVIVNSGPETLVGTFRERTRLVLDFIRRLLIVHGLGMRAMGEFLGKRLLPEPEYAEPRRILVDTVAANDKQAYLAALWSMRGWSIASQLSAIQCPTMVIAADQDYTPLAYKAAYVASMPDAELVVIRDSRHFTPVERADKFNAALEGFLAKFKPQRAPRARSFV